MVTIDELRARVEAAYAVLGLPSWPDPWPGGTPDDAAYSRVTDPGRHRVVAARAQVWASVLRADLGVLVEEVAGSTRLASPQPGTLPLLLVAEETLVRLFAGDREWPLELVPDCGCDACDAGSADLLRALDDTIADYVQGPTVLLRGSGWGAHWGPDTRSAGGSPGHPDFDGLMATCRLIAAGEPVDLPRGTLVAVNRTWLG